METVILSRGSFVYSSLDFPPANATEEEKEDDPRKPHWPNGSSGVTIGRGFDIGAQVKPSNYQEHLDLFISIGISERNARLLLQGAQVKGSAAEKLTKQLRNVDGVEISATSVFALFEHSWTEASDKVKNIIKSQTDPNVQKGYKVLHPVFRDALNQFGHSGNGQEEFKVILNKTKFLDKISNCQPNDIESQAFIIKELCENILLNSIIEDKKRPANLLLYADRILQTAANCDMIIFSDEPISLASMLAASQDPNNKSLEWAEYIQQYGDAFEDNKNPTLPPIPVYNEIALKTNDKGKIIPNKDRKAIFADVSTVEATAETFAKINKIEQNQEEAIRVAKAKLMMTKCFDVNELLKKHPLLINPQDKVRIKKAWDFGKEIIEKSKQK